jgi:hypothetical protein
VVDAAGALRHNSLEAELAGPGEDERAFAAERFAEHDSVAAPLDDEPHERFAPLLKRSLAEINAV